jgi:hypothetical protein
MSNFIGFKEHRVPVHSEVVGDIEIYAKVGGSGPGLLLIHGYPQCHQWVPYFFFHILHSYSTLLHSSFVTPRIGQIQGQAGHGGNE